MYSFEPAILDKFCGLLTHLSYARAEFEIVADEIEDHSLKTALNGLSEESEQYRCELCIQLKEHGFEYRAPGDLTSLEAVNRDAEPASHEKNEELQQICRNNEHRLTRAYREILNEQFPFPEIREIMLYQLNMLRSAFMKINVLNTHRFSHPAINF